ncbi:GNAT family N-acetyltransferase [Palleronia sp.]|uniref:GNAT family N-acetyltransferase n=1 Tax=Palleronia sp. TaxID=1940284 RepID=UPI0035C870B8
MILRPARASDAPALAAILSDWIDRTDWMPRIHTRDEDRGFLSYLIASATVTVASRAGRAIGFLARRGDEIPALYVASPGEGTGTLLLQHSQATRPGGFRLWTFRANTGARRFYARHGFRPLRATEGDNEEKLPDVLLHWRAPAPKRTGSW